MLASVCDYMKIIRNPVQCQIYQIFLEVEVIRDVEYLKELSVDPLDLLFLSCHSLSHLH